MTLKAKSTDELNRLNGITLNPSTSNVPADQTQVKQQPNSIFDKKDENVTNNAPQNTTLEDLPESKAPAQTEQAEVETPQNADAGTTPPLVESKDGEEAQAEVNVVSEEVAEPEKPESSTQKTDFEIYAEQQGFDKDITIDDLYKILSQKIRENEPLSEIETKLVNDYLQSQHKDNTNNIVNNIQGNGNLEQLQRTAAYTKLLISKSDANNPEQKTHKLLDKYLTENSSEYNGLKTDDEKKQYRQSYIDKFSEQLITWDPKDKSKAQNYALKNINALVYYAGTKGKDLNSYLMSENLTDTLHKIKAEEFSDLITKLGIDDKTKDDRQVVNNAITTYLLLEDENFANLSKVEQDKKIKETLNSFVSKFAGIDLTNVNLSEAEEKNILTAARSMLLYAADEMKKNNEFSLDFISKSEKAAARFICKWAETHDDSVQGNILGTIVTRAKIINELGLPKGKQPTERDIYNKLLELEKTGGEAFDDNAKNLLNYYKNLQEIYKDTPAVFENLLNEKSSIKSLTSRAALLGMTPEEFVGLSFRGKTGKELDAAVNELFKGIKSPAEFYTLISYLNNTNYPEGKIRDLIQNLSENEVNKLNALGITLKDGDGLAFFTNKMHEHGTEQQIASFAKTEQVIGRRLDVKAMDAYIEKTEEGNLYNAFLGINERPKEETVQIMANAQANPNNALSKISYMSETLVETASSERQLYYSEQFSQMGNAAVMEGLAAAEQSVDQSVRDQYSQNLDNALNNGDYTPEQVNLITKARQTGQTAPERGESYPEGFSTSGTNSSSSSSSSGTGKSSSSQGTSGSRGTSSSHGTSGSNGTSGSSNTPKTGSSSNSSSAQSAAAQARAQAQQDYAQAVTQALQLRKEEALKRLAQITENYQKSVKEREERKAKEAQKTQKTEEQSTNKDYSKFNPEVRKVLEESDRVFESADKTLEIAKIDSALTDAEIAVPADKREELIQAYQSGGAAYLYEKLGSVSTKYQEQYLHYFAEHASTSDLCSFAEKHVGNKNIILALYQRSNNPALLQYLGESNALDLLNKGKIKLEDFLKYASPDTVARYIQSMKEIGNTDAIKAVVSQLSLKQREETSESVIAEAQNNTPLPGSDEWIRAQQKQMENASNLGVEPKASAPKRETEKLNLDGSTPTIGAGMLSLNPEEDEFDGLSMGSNRVRMGIDIKKRDKRFFRIG